MVLPQIPATVGFFRFFLSSGMRRHIWWGCDLNAHWVIRIRKGSMSCVTGEKVGLNSSDASACSKNIVCLRTISSILVYKLHVCRRYIAHIYICSDCWFTGTY